MFLSAFVRPLRSISTPQPVIVLARMVQVLGHTFEIKFSLTPKSFDRLLSIGHAHRLSFVSATHSFLQDVNCFPSYDLVFS